MREKGKGSLVGAEAGCCQEDSGYMVVEMVCSGCAASCLCECLRMIHSYGNWDMACIWLAYCFANTFL